MHLSTDGFGDVEFRKCLRPDRKKPTETTCPCERVSVQAMSRSRSWPMLYTVPEEDTVGGVAVATIAAVTTADGQRADAEGTSAHQLQYRVAAPAANVGRLLRRHYYPEAGWGWVVVACACMVHLLNHGTQLSFGALERDVVNRFRDATYSKTGQWQPGSQLFISLYCYNSGLDYMEKKNRKKICF